MAFTFTSGPHWSIQRQFPPNKYRTNNTGTWGSGGNTCVITDPAISPNSDVRIWVTGTTAAAGRWAVSCSSGSATITSSDAEDSALTLAYYVN